ncbi:MAG: HAMP domain-containing histidine kinase, partial [Candidatus Margulisbacteria bacterium]|nr:HAMP domain-containing histidine kinase [Candidatus Margulisiibacteriota bacterium]
MIKVILKITQAEKIKTLETSSKAIIFMIPLLYILLLVFRLFGFIMPWFILSIILFMSWGLAFLQFFLVKKKWLIDQSYGGLFTFAIVVLIALGVFFSGAGISPFIWVAVFVALFDTLNYDLRRGMLVAIFFAATLWLAFVLQTLGMISFQVVMPGFSPGQNLKFILSALVGDTMIFLLGPLAVDFLSDQLRREKSEATELAIDKEKSYHIALSIMEDLEDARKQLEKNNQELKKMDKVKDEFLALVTHDLKTPLVPILGYSDILLGNMVGDLSDQQKSFIDIIKREANKLRGMIDAILDYTRAEFGRIILTREVFSINVEIVEAVEEIKPQADQAKIEIALDLPSAEMQINGDKNMIARVI